MLKKFNFVFILLLFCSIALFSCDLPQLDSNEPNVPDNPPKEIKYEISLDINNLELEVGEEKTLTATLLADGKKSKDEIKWSTSNGSVASVTDGTVKALAEGTVIITASAHGKSATARVTITEPEPFLILSASSLEIKVGETAQLNAWLTVGEAENIEYISSDSSVVSVSSTGFITAVEEGDAIITVTAGDGLTSTCKVNVLANYELIFPEIVNKDVFIGDKINLNTVVQINGQTSSEKPTISGEGFTVDGNEITITDDGEITIKVEYRNAAFTQTINSWIKVSTTDEFLAIKDNLDGHFLLVNDLDFAGAKVKAFSSWNTWSANPDAVFKGVFNGQNYTIKNLQPIPESGNDAAIFGYMAAGSVVKNVNFTGVVVEGRSAVVASWVHGLIENVYLEMTYASTYVSESVASDNNPAGTLVAKVQGDAIIRNCIVNLSLVDGAQTTKFGALASRVNSGAQITNCYVLCSSSLPLAHVGVANIDSSSKLVSSLNDLNEALLEDGTFDKNWTIAEGQVPHVGKVDAEITVAEPNVMAYTGMTTHLTAISKFELSYSLANSVSGVTLSKDGALTIADSVADGTVFDVLVSNLYGGKATISVTVRKISIKISGGNDLPVGEFILGVTNSTIAHGVVVKENNVTVTSGLSFVTSNESVATVDNTNVTIKGVGTARISVIYNGVEIHSFDVTVDSIWHPVRTTEEFLAMGASIEAMSYNYKLMNDIDFEGATILEFSSWNTWDVNNSDVFTGKFDGQGYTVYNFQPIASAGTNNPSIFGYMDKGSVVKNVNFIGVIGADRFSLVSSYCLGTVENVYAEIKYISTSTTTPNANNPAATLVGKAQSSSVIKNCVVNLILVDNAQTTYLGALVGRAYANATIANCYVLCGQSLPLVSNNATTLVSNSNVVTTLSDLNNAINADSTYGSNWTVVSGQYPHLGTVNSSISTSTTVDVYAGTSVQLNATSKVALTYSLSQSVTGVTLSADGELIVSSTVANGTTVKVIVSNNYGGQKIITVTVKVLTFNVTSVGSVTVDECIIGESNSIIAHNVNVTQSGAQVTNGITYASSNEAVATVNATNVTIKGQGTAKISVLYNGAEIYSFDVTVSKIWHPVKTVEDFLAIGASKTSMSYNYKLMNNLDFKGAQVAAFSSWNTWNADNDNVFKGVFDGQGYTISNIQPVAQSGSSDSSIFGYMDIGSVVKNVNFIGVIGADRFSLVSSYCLGTIENVYAEIEYISTSTTIANANNPAATLVGKAQSHAVIKNCVVKLSLVENAVTTNFGSLIGKVLTDKALISNCYVLCEQTLPLTYSGASYMDSSSKAVTTLAELNTAIKADSTYGSNWLVVDGQSPKVVNDTK